MPPTDSPPIAGPVLIEDDDETIYNPITPTPDAVVEHLEDSLTIPDDDSSDVVTVYDDCDSLTMEKPLADTSSRVNHQIPIEVSEMGSKKVLYTSFDKIITNLAKISMPIKI